MRSIVIFSRASDLPLVPVLRQRLYQLYPKAHQFYSCVEGFGLEGMTWIPAPGEDSTLNSSTLIRHVLTTLRELPAPVLKLDADCWPSRAAEVRPEPGLFGTYGSGRILGPSYVVGSELQRELSDRRIRKATRSPRHEHEDWVISQIAFAQGLVGADPRWLAFNGRETLKPAFLHYGQRGDRLRVRNCLAAFASAPQGEPLRFARI